MTGPDSVAAMFREFITTCAPNADLETVESIRKIFYASASSMLAVMLDEWKPTQYEVMARHRLMVLMSECVHFCCSLPDEMAVERRKPS